MILDPYMLMYFCSILAIIFGGALGYMMFRNIAAIFVFNLGFGILAYLIFPAIWGLV